MSGAASSPEAGHNLGMMRPERPTGTEADASRACAAPEGLRAKRLRLWGPRLAVAVVAAAYAAQLVHEMNVGLFPLAALPFQLALASPVILLFALGTIALQQQVLQDGMTRRVRRLVFWVPRIALLAFALFVGLFTLDVFGAGYSLWETLLGLLIHLIPTLILLVATMLAWRRPWVGAACSTGWTAWYLLAFWDRFPTSVYALMAGAPLLVALLFVLDWRCKFDAPRPSSRTNGEV